MVTSAAYRHVPTGTLAVLAQRLGKVSASPSTWYRLARAYGWRRLRLRVHPAKPKVGLRTTRPDEMWHIDTTVIRLLDGTRAYLPAVIDNFSRRVLAWRVAETFAPMNSVAVLLDATRGAVGSTTAPVVLADAGVENVNAAVDALIETGVLRRLLAFTELRFSNSMIEAWWRSLKHQWLYLHSLDSVARTGSRGSPRNCGADAVSGSDSQGIDRPSCFEWRELARRSPECPRRQLRRPAQHDAALMR
jgi:putative transposase